MRSRPVLIAGLVCMLGAAGVADEPRRAGPDWWALQPIRRPVVPPVSDPGWLRNPIDAFILARLDQHGLAPAPPADRRTLARRVWFDLTGLPPDPDSLADFLNDHAPDAYERLVDRLLASPQYGERWGRHWLDVARFGESDGFENDKPRDHAWHYRDYVIRSFNADTRFDRFMTEQIAGDAIEPITRDSIAATGFLVAGPWDEIQNVAKSSIERMRAHEEQIEELIAAVSQTFLGLTVQCARCHDHKFDPIPQSDYYAFKAVFDGVDHGTRPLFPPGELAEHERSLAPLRQRIAELRSELSELRARVPGDALARDRAALARDGRFHNALDARSGHAEAAGKTAYQTAPITVECWARLASKAGFNVLVANNRKESPEHWEIYSYAGSGEFSAFLPGYEPAEIKSGVEITDGAWHHLAMTMDGSVVKLYVDAKLVNETPVRRRASPEPSPRIGPLVFGGYPPQRIGCDGSIDDVRISSVVRQFQHPPESPAPADEHTIGLWRFDELDGARFADATAPQSADTRTALREREQQLGTELTQRETELTDRAPPLVYAGTRKQPAPTHVLLRGDIGKPGPRIDPRALSAVADPPPDLELPADAPETARRARFAHWLANPHHPLVPRVFVNRVWHYHFGIGLVDTPSDFGANGGDPSHPDLLDWLASEWVRPGNDPTAADAWSIKRLHRMIVLSATYRQSSSGTAAAASIDADNRLLSRFPLKRLEAEAIRDAMLAAAGNLNPEMFGTSVRPFTITIRNTYFYHRVDSDEPPFNRRTVYRMNINTGRDPLLDALDCPAPSITAPQRRSTMTPLQSLSLMNDSFVVRQASRMADLIRARTPDAESQVRYAYHRTLGRPPDQSETSSSRQLVQSHGLESLCWTLFNSSEFLHVR